MRNIETPNNNPFLSGLVFLLISFAAVLLFAAALKFADGPAALHGNGGGEEFLAPGEGSGTGTGKGSGSHDGESRGSGDSAEGKEDGRGKSGDDAGKSTESEAEQKNDSAGKGSESPAPQPEKKKAEKKSADDGTFTGEQIFIGGDTQGGETYDSPVGSPSGKPSFSSGGKNVFQVKKHSNVLYIVDVSSSMNALTSERLPRIEVLKLQLKASLSSQRQNGSIGKYGILAFSVGTNYFPAAGRQMKFSSRTDLEQAEKWIDGLDKLPRGGTPIFQTLQEAFAMAKKKGMEIDAIYLLTDGEPTDVSDVNQYLDLIAKKLPRKARIHTISIGQHSPLLEEIAKKGRGTYANYQ